MCWLESGFPTAARTEPNRPWVIPVSDFVTAALLTAPDASGPVGAANGAQARGPGLTTDWLFPRVGKLTALEYDQHHAAAPAARRPAISVVHCDATKMPFGDKRIRFCLSAFTMLHHVTVHDLQDQLFCEAARVLRPGGIFAGSDRRWSRVFALAHLGVPRHRSRPPHEDSVKIRPVRG